MTIKFRGYLKNNNPLKSVDESRLEKMAIGWIDYLFVFLIILYPLTKSLKLLISKYNGKILNVFLIDILGFIIVILLMIVHEYFHAITFSKKEDIYIWFQGFGMITHCTEIKNVKEYLYTLLLPNLLIPLPLSIFVIFVKLSNPLILKMIGLVSSIIILGAINDLATIVYIIRNRKQIEYLQLSGKYMYYKKK